jgi:hypothetical protein
MVRAYCQNAHCKRQLKHSNSITHLEKSLIEMMQFFFSMRLLIPFKEALRE